MANRSWVLATGYDPMDFPLYDGRPTDLAAGRWVGLVAATATALLVRDLVRSDGWALVATVALPLVPLVLLAWWAPGQWTALFRRPGRRDLAWCLVAGLACALVAVLAAAVAWPGAGLVPGTAVDLAMLSSRGLALAWLEAVVLLAGEELLALLAFLALLTAAWRRGLSRRHATALAWAGATLAWTLLQLPLYDVDVGRTLVVAGTTRGILLAAYVRTKNAWVPLGAHGVQDTAGAALAALS